MIKIFTVAAIRYDLIELQLRSFERHLKYPFELIVLNNDSPRLNPSGNHAFDVINHECFRLNVQAIEVTGDQGLIQRLQPCEPTPILNHRGHYSAAGTANEYALCWAWEKIISKEKGFVGIIHPDAFLVGDLRPDELLSEYDLLYVPQSRAGIREYMWDMFVLLNMGRLPAPETICWMGGRVNGFGGDVGVQTSRYLDKHQEIRVMRCCTKPIDDSTGFGRSDRRTHEVISIDDRPTVLHYVSATNWDGQSVEFHRDKTAWLRKMLA